jgi:hypothetical protein
MITIKGRGRGSAAMTTRDGMRLVLGLAASDTAADAPTHVEIAEAAKLIGEPASVCGVPIAAEAEFGETLVRLIEAHREERSRDINEMLRSGRWADLRVRVKTGGMLCEIECGGAPLRFLLPSGFDARTKAPESLTPLLERDLRTIREFTWKTLGAICSCTVAA